MSEMATSTLGQGKLQFWMIRGNVLLSTWKTADDPNASWAPLRQFVPSPGGVDGIAAGTLSDGRVQLFATQGDNTMTIWKQNTNEDSLWVSGAGEAWDSFSP